ncbi:MAG: DUF721 domain-containing protein [Marinovum sp.]|nr:DUF721 domain-containing protein [Marinovum sp.]
MTQRVSTTKGFKRTASVLSRRIQDVGASRGFAVSRILTHWEEIVGPDIASVSRPVDVNYGRGGLGATLSLLTTGPQAPMLEMQKEAIRDRVNACYGYNAIARVRITQTATTGFAEGQAVFDHAKPQSTAPKQPSQNAIATAEREMLDVADPDLRAALTRLGAHIHDKS